MESKTPKNLQEGGRLKKLNDESIPEMHPAEWDRVLKEFLIANKNRKRRGQKGCFGNKRRGKCKSPIKK